MIYVIKSSLILSFIYLLYQFLRNDISFNRNRALLVFGMLISVVLPLINFGSVDASSISKVFTLPVVTISPNRLHDVFQYNFSLFYSIIILYSIGVVFLSAKKVIALIRLANLLRISDIESRNGYKLVFIDPEKSPSSFFNFIFINKGLTEEETVTIITHEGAHIYKRHSIDVLFMELLIIIQWINPLVWLYRISLREVHEFQADRLALNNGIEKAGYIQLLLAMALNTSPADLTNNFCQIKLKRRLKMITKIKNSRFTGLKFTFTIPVMILFIWMVSCENQNNTNNSNETQKTSSEPDSTKSALAPSNQNNGAKEGTDEVFTVVEDMPKYPGGDEARMKFIVSNIKYPKVALEKGIQGTVVVSFIVDVDGTVKDTKVLRGIGGGCDEEALRVIKMMPKWSPGKQSEKNVKVAFNLPVKFALS